MNRNVIRLAAVTLVLSVVFPMFALAFTPPSYVPKEPSNARPLVSDVRGVFDFINNIITYFFYVIMLVAVILILYAAFKYLTAQGNPENVAVAQKIILYAVIAIVVAVLARSIPFVLESFVSSNTSGSSPNYGPNY